MKPINLPYFSQHTDVVDSSWKDRACGVACLAMVIEYFRPGRFETVDDLITEGISIGAFSPKGWEHRKLVIMAHNYRVMGYMEEFRSKNPEYEKEFVEAGIKKIIDQLNASKPVIISTYRNWTEEGKFHMMVLSGVKEENGAIAGFYYSDPDTQDAEHGKGQFIDLEKFKKHWRRLAIFLG